MKKKLNLYYSTRLYEELLITNNQLLAQEVGQELMQYKQVYDNGKSVTDWIGIAKAIDYPQYDVYNDTGEITKDFRDVIKALQDLAVNGYHNHLYYKKLYLHNKNIIEQN